VFNYWLNQVSGYDIGPVIGQLFPGCGTGGACDTSNITFSQFWTTVSQYLQTSKGLSGIALGRAAALAAALRGLGCVDRYTCVPDSIPYSNAIARMTSAGTAEG
jgi:hypothetical protein